MKKFRPRGKSDLPKSAQFGRRRSPQSRPTGRTRTVEGTVSASRAGFGFVHSPDMPESVFLPPREMTRLVHGDRVRVRAEQGADQRWSGHVETILERATAAFLATVSIRGRNATVQAADRKLGLYCTVPPAQLGGARDGDWVIVRVDKYPEEGRPGVARVLRVLDPDRPVTLATETAIARFGLPRDFSAAALRDAQAHGTQVAPEQVAARTDLRALPLVTIDGEDARDFDDAVYAEKAGDGWRLVVAIADVSHYVREGSALDDEARERGTSVYFPQRVVPMLPPALSDELCSLQPRVDRLCLVADMQVSKTGALKAQRFYPAVMRSAARLTYSLAFAALFEGRPEARRQIGPLTDRLLPLVDLYRALVKARHRRGALDFDAPEAQFVISPAEKVTAIELPRRNDAHRLIEECMVLANVAAATELSKHR
ncbi:MAG: ribonuclease R, partial [Nevskiaceae bacterium]|nr:ribonuclease R [Nevskiaceae bacterium]